MVTRTDGRYAPCARPLRGSGLRPRVSKVGSLSSLIERGDTLLNNLQTPLNLDSSGWRKHVALVGSTYIYKVSSGSVKGDQS